MRVPLVFSFAIIPAIIFPQYKNPEITGNHKIETSSYTFTDENRIEEFTDTGENRKVTVEFWYPKEAEGKYPLIIFSHGAFGVKMSNTSTFMELASNGYVVCSIDHPYHAAGTMDVDVRDCIEKTNRLVLGFFNCYLKEEGTSHERFVELLYN